MQTQAHPLESFFHRAVLNSYEGKLGLNDPELTDYVTRMLCDFSESGNLFRLRDAMGCPIEDLQQMVRAADPVLGTAPSFDAERSIRKYIGDYTLFVAGMCPEMMTARPGSQAPRPTLGELIQTGKESYFIVSQFNLFEYKKQAPLFTRLADSFERCILGLGLIREELGDHSNLPTSVDSSSL